MSSENGFLEKLARYIQAFGAKGKMDAESGLKPYTVEDIVKWVEKKAPNNHEAAELFADIMLECYMGGYNGGRRGVKVTIAYLPDQEASLR